jgi:hypothetical protein
MAIHVAHTRAIVWDVRRSARNGRCIGSGMNGMTENDATLHHIGFVGWIRSEPWDGFVRSLAMRWDGRIIYDPMQTVYVSFFQPALAGNAVIELAEPEGNGSAVHKFVQRGGGFFSERAESGSQLIIPSGRTNLNRNFGLPNRIQTMPFASDTISGA